MHTPRYAKMTLEFQDFATSPNVETRKTCRSKFGNEVFGHCPTFWTCRCTYPSNS